jgi:hypothetical protein
MILNHQGLKSKEVDPIERRLGLYTTRQSRQLIGDGIAGVLECWQLVASR